MKKILLSVLIIQAMFFIGCSAIDNQSMPTKDSEEVVLISKETDTINEENQSIYERLNKAYDLENKEEVYIRRINDEKFLVGYQEQFAYQMNPMFHIFDINQDQSIPIEGQFDFIDEIRVDQDFIEFFSKGSNIINGFKKFPNMTRVDIETGLAQNNNIYSRLGSDYKPFYMGNFLNETKLEKLGIGEEKIVFDFAVSENSILAGGDHCPNIQVISENNSVLSVDVENLVLSEEDLLTFKSKAFIEGLQLTSYTDGRGIKHQVINFQIESYDEYSCSFETGRDGIRDLTISFR
ncbi:MAG TPA: hypothetical protein VJ962_06655 [Clostridia bacterium]|nr:hypothetical protein [Clostridia bacterium]